MANLVELNDDIYRLFEETEGITINTTVTTYPHQLSLLSITCFMYMLFLFNCQSSKFSERNQIILFI